MEEYFRSEWSRSEIWQLELPVEEAPVSDFAWHLDQPFWSSEPPEPRFDIIPRSVLDNPGRYAEHYRRILESDTRFPLDVARFGSKIVILDGIHRLARLYHKSAQLIRFRHVPQELIRRVA